MLAEASKEELAGISRDVLAGSSEDVLAGGMQDLLPSLLAGREAHAHYQSLVPGGIGGQKVGRWA